MERGVLQRTSAQYELGGTVWSSRSSLARCSLTEDKEYDRPPTRYTRATTATIE
jgi:hypothetical protein